MRTGSCSPCPSFSCSPAAIKKTHFTLILLGIGSALAAIYYAASVKGMPSMGNRLVDPAPSWQKPDLGLATAQDFICPPVLNLRSEAPNEELDSLFQAYLKGSLQDLVRLIEKGMDLEKIDKYGKTPLDVAVQQNRTDVASCLIRHGAQLERKGFQPPYLNIAIRCGHREMTRFLVDAGADPFRSDAYGISPFQFALNNRKSKQEGSNWIKLYKSSLEAIQIFTKTDKRPAIASCKTLEEFLDVLFPSIEEKVKSKLEEMEKSPELQTLLSLSWDDDFEFGSETGQADCNVCPVLPDCKSKRDYPIMEEDPSFVPEEWIGQLQKNNPLFNKIWEELNQVQKITVRLKDGFPRAYRYDPREHTFDLIPSSQFSLTQQIYELSSQALSRYSDLDLTAKAENGEVGLDEYVITKITNQEKAFLLSKKQLDPDFSNNCKITRQKSIPTFIYRFREEWLDRYAVSFFKKAEGLK